MTHIWGHLECGGLGRLLGWVLLWFRDHEFLNVGVYLKHEKLEAKLVADGMSAAKAHRAVEKLGKQIHRDVENWYKLGEKLGLEYHEDEPWPGNITSPVVAAPYPLPPPP